MIAGFIIVALVIIGLLYTKNYRSEDIISLNKKENPFILIYPLSFRIIDQLKMVNEFKNPDYLIHAKKISIIIFMASITSVLCILLAFASPQDNDGMSNVVNRPDYVENAQNIDLNVYKDGEKTPFEVEFKVEAKQYTEEEVNDNFVRAYDVLLNRILKENESLEKVTGNLNLVTIVPEYAIKVEWYSSNYDIVDYDGTVSNYDFEAEHIESTSIQLTANLKYGDYSCEYPMDIMVFPPKLTEEEHFLKTVKNAIKNAVNSSIYEDKVDLPTTVNGITLKYERPGNDHSLGVIVVLGVLATIALLLGIEGQKRKEKNSRDRQLKYDYSEVISKLTLLAGAGMSISRAWEKISLDYKKQKENGTCKKHIAYEEMLITYFQMKAGVFEGKAYAEFGKRCNIKEYLKLGALLEQNLKKGTKGLTQMLEKESLEAFQERKNIAKRLGEEAGTKLLAPMGLMLIIVMIIVIVPALLSFKI